MSGNRNLGKEIYEQLVELVLNVNQAVYQQLGGRGMTREINRGQVLTCMVHRCEHMEKAKVKGARMEMGKRSQLH